MPITNISSLSILIVIATIWLLLGMEFETVGRDSETHPKHICLRSEVELSNHSPYYLYIRSL